jgi:hypothetical protein
MDSVKLALDCAADVLGVDPGQLAFDADDGPTDVLCSVWDAMIDADRDEEDEVYRACAAAVYGAFFADRAPTMTDVLSAAARGVDEEFLKLMFFRATDAPVSIYDWVKPIPGLEYVDDCSDKMAHPNRLSQMQNAVWALESADGYRYWPSGDGSNFHFLIDTFHRHYTDWLAGLGPLVSPEMNKVLTPLLTTSDNYFAQRLKSRYSEVYANV